MKISARNTLKGKILSINKGPVSTEVILEITPGVQIASSITTHSADAMGLKVGDSAYGIIKASSVMIGID